MLADGDAVDAEPLPVSVIRLHEHADCVAADTCVGHSRCCTDAAFETMAEHAGAPTDVPLGHRAAARCCERRVHILCVHVLTLDVVQDAVPRFQDNRRGAKTHRAACGDALRNECVAHSAHRPRARHRNRAAEPAAFAEKLESRRMRHPAQDMHAGEHRVAPHVAVIRDDDRDFGAHGAGTANAFPGAADQRCMTDRHACNIGDCVVRARRETTDDDPQVARARHGAGSVTGKPGKSWTCSSSNAATRLRSRATSASKRSRCALATPTSCSCVGIASRRCV